MPDFKPSAEIRSLLTDQYSGYVELVTGKMRGRIDIQQEWDERILEEFNHYVTYFLPYEIISWGGDVRVLFPQTCQLLDQHGIWLNQFVDFWFAYARPSTFEYNFFLFKVHVFVEFIYQVLPGAFSMVKQEAHLLVQGYVVACKVSPHINRAEKKLFGDRCRKQRVNKLRNLGLGC